MTLPKDYTQGQVADILAQRASGLEYVELAAYVSKTYGIDKSPDSLRRLCKHYQHLSEVTDAVSNIKVLKEIARVKRSDSHKAKQNRTILDHLNTQDDFLTQLGEVVAATKKFSFPKPPKKRKGLTSMTMEGLISDVHVGKKSDNFDLAVCKQRLITYRNVFLGEIERNSQLYNVEKILLSFLGDNIENARMHGEESMLGCEFGNPEQVRWAIELFLFEVVAPIAATGIPLEIVCIAGNHDREDEKKTFNNPGKNSLAWIVYHSMRMIADKMGIKAKWVIPEGVYHLVEIYGNNFLLEHGDNVNGNSRKVFNTHIAARASQLGKIIHGLRLGHWHEYTCMDNGRVIVNASVCGLDSYADVKGYNSMAGQAINYYVKTDNRPSSFFRSFLVQL